MEKGSTPSSNLITMARLKNDASKPKNEATVDEAQAKATEVQSPEETVETVNGEDAEVEEPQKVETEEVATEEVPEWSKRLMANFANLPELYITKTGGVFTKNTPKSLLKGAVLYKNPYYKK